MGLKTSREAAINETLRPILTSALEEASFGLCHELGFSEDEMTEWRQTILGLLENPYIEDNLQRLGADSRRKLGAYDRLVGRRGCAPSMGSRRAACKGPLPAAIPTRTTTPARTPCAASCARMVSRPRSPSSATCIPRRNLRIRARVAAFDVQADHISK